MAENTTPDPTCQDCVEGICPFQVLQDEPVLWKRNRIQQLPTIPGDPDGEVVTINDSWAGGRNFGSMHRVRKRRPSRRDLGKRHCD